jgi:hypothetical protein
MHNVSWLDTFELELAPPPVPPPPAPPAPPAPWHYCSPRTMLCVEVPPGTPGSFAGAADCAASCKLCDLGGTWFDSAAASPPPITIVQSAPAGPARAAVNISAPGLWSGAVGAVFGGGVGWLQVTGGFCGTDFCDAAVSAMAPGGPPCALISWIWGDGQVGNVSWCSPAADPQRCRKPVR